MERSDALRLAEISVYPLKGAGGFFLPETHLDSFGVPGDRRWMLADPEGGFLSQRTHPRLSLLRTGPALPGGGDGDPAFTVEGPGMGLIPLRPIRSGVRTEVRVHKDRFPALVGDREADEWFSLFLRERCRLVYIPDDVRRPVDPRWAPGYRVGLADGYPLHLTTRESLDALNGWLPKGVAMSNFRPNLVVEGGRAWDEDEWRVLEIGGVRVRLVKPCARCSVTTVDPEDGTRGMEPLKTMKSHREWEGKVYFGQNAVFQGAGRFSVGDVVRIIERGKRRPPLPT